MKGTYVPGQGSPCAKLLILGEAPGYWEDKEGKPFVGQSGRMLDEMLAYAGSSRSEVYTTNVYKYRPPDNDLSRIDEILSEKERAESIELVWREIESINPNVILCLGAVSLRVVTGLRGLNNFRGSLLKSLNFNKKVIATVHPANLLPGSKGMYPYSARAYIQLDINKAVKESHTSDLILPHRELLIARNSLDFLRFLRRFDPKTLAVDIETYKSIPSCISFAPSPDFSMSVPLLNMGGIDPIEVPIHELQELWKMVAEVLDDENIRKVGQNFKFDMERLLNTCLMRVRNFHADTMLMAHTLYPEFPNGLYFLTSILTNEPYYKDEYKDFNPKKDPSSQVLLYNAKDSAVTYEIFEKLDKELADEGLTSFYYDYLHKLNPFYMEMEDIGYRWNFWRQKWLIRKYDILINRKEKEFFDLIEKPYDPKFINSPKKIMALLSELGLPERDNTEEDTLVALLANHTKGTDKKGQVINLILDTRRVKKTKSTYLTAPPDYDDRMRTVYRIAGTETGRSSTGKLGTKTGKKSPVRPSEVGLAFQTVPERGYGHEIQRCFEADDGYELFSVDLRQAEPRVVALLSEDYELLKAFDEGVDIHRKTASWFFEKSIESITTEERFVGKIGRNGGNYDMHKHKLCLTIMSESRRAGIKVNISEKEAGRLIQVFHSFSPKIRTNFHAQIQEALKRDNRVLVTPHGRKRKFRDRWGQDLFREAYANIPQGTVRDHLSQAGLRIKERCPEILFQKESHDAFKGEFPIEMREKCLAIIREELETPIDFSRCSLPRGKLIIPVEMHTGKNLGEMIKVA